MKNLGVIILFAITFNTAIGQCKYDTLDIYIEKVMELFESPGLSVAIIDSNNIVFNMGFGTKTVGKNEPVDENTQFAIGSISKSFTAIALAILVDEGKLEWDDKVINYIPRFELYDPYVTSSFTIRDLLSHRSGLKPVSGGTLFYHSDLTKEDIITRLKYLKPESNFRTTPAYQNIMYVVAGKIVEVVSGTSYQDFIRSRIFDPLGMVNTIILEEERNTSNNITTSHIKNENLEIIPIKQEKLDNVAPAGSFYSSSTDMAKYIIFVLNKGIVGEDTLVRPSTFNEILNPQIHFKAFNGIHNEFTSYGFGWWLTPKNGHKIIDHSGGVDGAAANLIMIDEEKFGIIALSNTSNWSPFKITIDLIGCRINDEDYLKLGQWLKINVGRSDSLEIIRQKKFLNSQIKNTKPSLPISSYIGTFEDEMYGKVIIKMEGKYLKMIFEHTKLFSGKLEHWHYDTFKLGDRDPRIKDALITFEFNSKGEIIGFNIDQPRLLDVDFTEVKFDKVNK